MEHATQITASTNTRHDHPTAAGPSNGTHGGHGKHAGHHTEMFRRRFWWSLLLSRAGGGDQPHGHGLVRLRPRLRRHGLGRSGARHGHLLLGRLAVPRGRPSGGPGARSRG